MEFNSLTLGIFILFIVSILVRVLPSIITLTISSKAQEDIKSILPTAVFINLIVYCCYQEIEKSTLPALISIALMLVIFRKFGLLPTVITSSALYLGLVLNL